MLPLVLSAALALPPSFVPPEGWAATTPPPDAPVDYLWLSPHYGTNGNGENLAVMLHPVPPGDTLDAEVKKAIEQLALDRAVVNSHAEPTCHGLQAGWSFEVSVPLPNGKTIGQIYHLTIVGDIAYAFMFTHLVGDPIDPAVTASIQSICPTNPAT
jgi:hypothetical protein